MLTSTLTIMAQITTSALSGKVTTQDTKEEVIGATVQGPKTTYGSTVELIDVSVVNIKKSIVKVITVIGYKTSFNNKPQMSGAFYFEPKK